MRAFGPVPSRRLGQSLGINNIPPKVCTYSCVYCQIGKTEHLNCERQAFYEPDELAREVSDKVTELTKRNTRIDYLSFVPDGEPTLDINLGNHIRLIRHLNIKIAVITNGSLLNRKDVRQDLQKANLISVKIDAVSRKAWLRTDRPHKSLELETILEGIRVFSSEFSGEMITETMLLQGINDSPHEVQQIAEFLASLNPHKSYIAIPTRPTTVKGLLPASDQALTMCYQVFRERLPRVELLMGYGGDEFGYSGNIENDLLDITSVHPMSEKNVTEYLKKAGAEWQVITDLIERGSLVELEYRGHKFYLRRLPRKP
jgi:wyosine [tRNA(Phe)-imidazoG37] synthetase (radical SAM superfamily)